MTMIDRESAEKLRVVLRDILRDDDAQRAQMVVAALDDVLEEGLKGNNLPENSGPLEPGADLRSKFVRFFGITVQVAPTPPLPYTAGEITRIAYHSRDEYLRRVREAKVGDLCIEDQDELRDTQQFWRTIAADYEAIGMMAEGGKLEGLIRYYNGLDTADRDNFGWGADIWDEGRWHATLHQDL